MNRESVGSNGENSIVKNHAHNGLLVLLIIIAAITYSDVCFFKWPLLSTLVIPLFAIISLMIFSVKNRQAKAIVKYALRGPIMFAFVCFFVVQSFGAINHLIAMSEIESIAKEKQGFFSKNGVYPKSETIVFFGNIIHYFNRNNIDIFISYDDFYGYRRTYDIKTDQLKKSRL